MVNNIDFSKRIYCLITGASRGIGRTIAVELARRCHNNLLLVLLARSESDLKETEALVKQANCHVSIVLKVTDLTVATLQTYEQILGETFNNSECEIAMIFHNVGQIGVIKKAIELNDENYWSNYYKLNVISVALLNSAFLNKTKEYEIDVLVVNITSLVGRQPIKYLSMYGSAKAARDMYFKVLAKEEQNIAVLNYSPGMVKTAMSDELLVGVKELRDSDIKADEVTVLEASDTVNNMLNLIEKGEYTSGDIIDYYD